MRIRPVLVRIVNTIGDGLFWLLWQLMRPRKRVITKPDGSTWISRDRDGRLPPNT